MLFIQTLYIALSLVLIFYFWSSLRAARAQLAAKNRSSAIPVIPELQVRLAFSPGGRARLDRMCRLINAADYFELISDAVEWYERYLEIPLGKKLVIVDENRVGMEEFRF